MPKRYVLVVMCFLATFICYIDRVNISVAIIPMAEHFGWSDTTKGFVLSSFFIGYLLFMVPCGWIANRHGGRLLMGAALTLWSLFTILTPIAAGLSFAALIAVRIAMGAGESASFPAVYNLFARWLPPIERSRAVALNLTGISVGTIFALSTTGWLVTRFGWESVFYVFGAAGLGFAGLWFAVIRDRPSLHPTISGDERALLGPVETAGHGAGGDVPWRRIFTTPAIWAIIVNHFCANWLLYLMLAWLPSYFRDVQGLSITSAGLFAVGPWVCQFAAGNLFAAIADRLIARGVDVTLVRKSIQISGLLGAAVCMLLAADAASPMAALAVMCAALFFGGMLWAGFASSHLDVAPRHADVLFAITNSAGTLPGVFGVALTGVLLDLTGSYDATFWVAAGILVFGAIVWLLFGTGKKLID
jgi:ACS family sodium-dependent inorganic phosphate cotransporter